MFKQTTTWVAAFCLLWSMGAWAQDATELRARAETEIRQAGQAQASSTDAQVSESMLSLKDPMPRANRRAWDYFLGLSIQNFTPSGSGGNDLTDTRFAMNEAGATVMPALVTGFRVESLKRQTWSLAWGLAAKVGYSHQKIHPQFATGFAVDDAFLSSTLVSAQPELRWTLTRLPKLSLRTGGEIGTINYTQSSSNKMAAFSERANFYGANLGLSYALFPAWSVGANYVHRQLLSSSQIGVQPDNYELGTQVTW